MEILTGDVAKHVNDLRPRSLRGPGVGRRLLEIERIGASVHWRLLGDGDVGRIGLASRREAAEGAHDDGDGEDEHGCRCRDVMMMFVLVDLMVIRELSSASRSSRGMQEI